MPERQRPLFVEIRARDKEFYDRLEKAGFLLDFGEDDTGLHTKYIRRGSGYYIDVGASELIIGIPAFQGPAGLEAAARQVRDPLRDEFGPLA